jgi:XTP/dITP diphosphohydrolase
MKKKLVFATNNAHKIEEVRALLAAGDAALADRYEILSLSDIGCTEEIPETSDTLSGNALQKAEYVKVRYGYDCFADDSGLEVRALGMEPGVRSARYATEGHDSAANIRKLLGNLKGVTDRTAQFRTVIVLLSDAQRHDFEGICRGSIRQECSGTEGFGYDPVFQPEGYDCTFAEMSMEDKNAISHRGKVVRALVDFLTHVEG